MRSATTFFLALGLCSGSLQAETEFFFNTSPSDPPKLINNIARAFPLTSVGHGTLYISSACRDPGGEGNLIRPCTEKDESRGLVISFDVDLQKNTEYYFLAVSRDEFFYGNLDKNNLPPKITRSVVDDMDAYFYARFPLLKSPAYFERHVAELQKKTGVDEKTLRAILTGVSRRGVTRQSLKEVVKESGVDINPDMEQDIWETAKYFEKNGISTEGMSRRVVTWAVLLYGGVWGLTYPTTSDEELSLINYVNSLSKENANLLNVNCVMPLDIAGGVLTGGGSDQESAPRVAYVPYFVMKRIVKGAFEAKVGDVNEFGEFIRRPGVHMNFYPQVDIDFASNVPRAPKSVFQEGDLVGFYRRYQSKYANYIDWLVEQLKSQGVESDSDTVKELKALREEVFEAEKSINKLKAQYEGSRDRNPELAQEIERLNAKLLDKFDDEIARLVGTQPVKDERSGDPEASRVFGTSK
jgi:hypothetical protein